jgi:hypothetical protein
LFVLAACRLDMHDQPRTKPLRRSDFFMDARTERPLLPGVVARGQFHEDAYYYTGMVGPNKPGNDLPFPLTAEVLRRGQERFNIYCSPCHSRVGDGNGMIVQRGYRKPPSYHTDQLRTAPLGHFFDVMTNGFGAMPDYRQQVEPADRWAIAAYIRALQLSQNARLSDVPADMQKSIATEPSVVPSIGGSGTLGEVPAATGAAGEPPTQGNEAAPGQVRAPQQNQQQSPTTPQADQQPQQGAPPSSREGQPQKSPQQSQQQPNRGNQPR